MKKIITKVVAVILLTLCAFSLVACGVGPKPNFDLVEAYQNLKSKKHVVSYDDYFSSDPSMEEQLTVMGSNSFTIIKFNSLKMARLTYKEIKQDYKNQIQEYNLEIELLEFYIDEYKAELDAAEIDTIQEQLNEIDEEYEKFKEDYCYGISGKYVWYGDLEVLKDTK